MRKVLVVLAALTLTGCAVLRADGSSWVEDVPEGEAAQLAARIADLAAGQLAPGDKVRLAAGRDNAAGREVETHLKAALQARGINVAEGAGEAAPRTMRYLVTLYGKELLLRVRVDDAEATTMLARGKGGEIIATSPLAVRKVQK